MPAPVVHTPDRTYEINEVARLTGLAPARLRAWERRYEVVRPRRLPNGYRVYTGEQVALLRAYARLVEAGERIGDLAAQAPEVVLSRIEPQAEDGSPLAALLGAIR
ncbi:MAG TPA: MerR family transcriptional regulator, partial [Gemmatimonadales bacterium]|nr:MerR family transcriptional regulator [Gemmatimonadales bacterium]